MLTGPTATPKLNFSAARHNDPCRHPCSGSPRRRGAGSAALPEDLRLTPEQFASVCAANPEAVLELTADGRLIVMTPTGSETGARNSRLAMRLLLWADRQGGCKVFDSSTGFLLPDGSVRSPDASLVRLERWQALTAEQRRGLPPSARTGGGAGEPHR